MRRYFWLIPAYRQLIAPILRHCFYHAWLISYITGSGEKQLIEALIAMLLCQSKKETACGLCHSCLLYKAGNHPDFYHITVEKGKKLISVSQIRKLIDQVYERAQQGGTKVIWIENSSLMSEGASNALLKTLEEPASDTYFILSEQSPKAIKSTIRSRCRRFYLPPPELIESIHWLEERWPDYSYSQIQTALLLCRKAPLAAEELLQSDNWHKRQQFCELLKTALTTDQFWFMLHQLDYSNDFSKQSTWFCSLLVDAIKKKECASDYIVNLDQSELINLLVRYDHETISRLYTLWQTAAQKMRSMLGLSQPLIIANLLAQCEIVVASPHLDRV